MTRLRNDPAGREKDAPTEEKGSEVGTTISEAEAETDLHEMKSTSDERASGIENTVANTLKLTFSMAADRTDLTRVVFYSSQR